LTLPGVLFVQA